MSMDEELRRLEQLRAQRAISEDEYHRQRYRILNSENYGTPKTFSGFEENTYLAFMHISQFAGFLIPGLGFIMPIILWLINADKSVAIDMHGKNIANFMISMLLYIMVGVIFCFTIIGMVIGIPMLIILAVLEIIFVIIGTVKANEGEYWSYPLAIKFFS